MMKSRVLTSPLAKACLYTGAALSFASMLIGCGQSSLPTNDALTGASLAGTVHGGQQPVTGATVQLYQVGTTGYGKGSAALGSSTTTDANGNFSLTGHYTCPSTSTLVYLVVTGGNPGLTSGTNPNLKLVSALGTCGSLTGGTNLVINEVTTAAAAYALSQYFTTTYGAASTDAIGSPSTAQALTGITNAFTTAQTLASINSGGANGSFTTNGAGGAITVLPEALKLQTVADILAACVNTAGGASGDGSACGTLFADSGPTGTTPTDTMQAAVLLNLNPTSTNANGSANNITALYGLITTNSPFPAAATQPTDWTVGVQYTGTATTMGEPQSLAIDAGGNVWVVNNPSGGGSLNEITPGGSMPVYTTLNTTVAGTAATLTANNPRNVAIDLSGNVYVPASSSTGILFEYTSAGAVNAVAVGKSPYGIAIDAANNVWVTQESSTATSSLTEYLGGILSANSQVTYPVIGSATALPSYSAFDVNGNLWVSSGANLSTASNIVEVTATTASTCTAYPCAASATYTNVTGLGTEPFGLAATSTAMIAANAVSSNLSSVTLTTPTPTNFGSTASVNTPRFPVIDGAGNIWVSNRGTGSISEFSASGAVLSPVPASGATTPVGFLHSGITAGNGMGIDPSGNVWVADNTTTASSNDTYSIFEIVGAAAPAVTPLALALKNNAIGVKP